MHAVGHYVIQNSPSKRVLYVSSEMFTNELVNAIQNKKNEEFRNKYRGIDLLMIDDIQFIEKKDRTQEELFHTFETLYGTNKQIIFCSDRPPKEIETIDARLKSRFEWGLTVDIQSPDFETRVAILKNKAEMEDIQVNEDLLEIFYLIADKITSNIRELEGALNRVIARQSDEQTADKRDSEGSAFRSIRHLQPRHRCTADQKYRLRTLRHQRSGHRILQANQKSGASAADRHVSLP